MTLGTARTLDVRNPRTGQFDYQIAPPSGSELAALSVRLRQGQSEWLQRGFAYRIAALEAWAAAIEAHADRMIEALVADTGRHLISHNEVLGAAKKIRRWCAEGPALVVEETVASKVAPALQLRPQHVPYGLVGIISPWNFPITLPLIDAIPALLAGCAVIVKPSELTPRFIAPMRDAIRSVPALAAVFDMIPGDGETGSALLEQVDAVCFTGSVATGRKIAAAAASRFIPAFLELGGKDPAVVLASADLDRAADAILRQSVVNSGQVCLSIERIYVDRSIHDRFVDRLCARAKTVRINYPDIRAGHLGPIMSARQAAIISDHLADAIAKGAQVRCGGAPRELGGGVWCDATVVTQADHSMRLMQEETFGPVMPVMAFDTVDEAVNLANDTMFGLSAAVFAATVDEALAVARRIEAGAVSINDAGLQSMTTEAEKNSFKLSGMGGSRMGSGAILRFFRKKALMIQTGMPRTIEQFSEASAA